MNAAAELVRRSCAAQKLPEKVGDPATLNRVAAILVTRDEGPANRASTDLTTVSNHHEGGGHVHST